MKYKLQEKKSKVWPVRLSDTELKELLTKANKYTNGKIAAYIRWAALNFDPKKAA